MNKRKVTHDKNDITEKQIRQIIEAIKKKEGNNPTREEQKQKEYIAKRLFEIEQQEEQLRQLKEFETREQAPNIPNLNIPPLDTSGINEPNERTIRRDRVSQATTADEKAQYIKHIFQKAIEEKDLKHIGTKEWIPKPNESLPKKYLGIGKDYKLLEQKEAEQPMMLLMRIDNIIDVFQGVKEGLFKLKIEDNNGKEEVKGIVLTADMLHKIPYGNGEFLKVWICHENEATPYPVHVTHSSNLLVEFIEKILLNYRALDEGGPSGIWGWITKILPWLAGAAIVVYLLYYFKIIPNGAVQAAVNATNVTHANAIVKIPTG